MGPIRARRSLATELYQILEVWNHTEDPELSVARARVPPGVTTRWHRLQGIAARYLILSGQGLAEIEGMAPTAVQPGDLIYIPRGQAQRIRNTGTEGLLFYALCTPRFRWVDYQALEGPEQGSHPPEDSATRRQGDT